MKTLSVLAALAFALAGSTVYAQACDYGVRAANATSVVVAGCGYSGCATDEPVTTTQEPITNPEPAAPVVAGCGNGSGCATEEPTTQEPPTAKPEPAAPKVACSNSPGCATDDPPPAAPTTLASCGSAGC